MDVEKFEDCLIRSGFNKTNKQGTYTYVEIDKILLYVEVVVYGINKMHILIRAGYGYNTNRHDFDLDENTLEKLLNSLMEATEIETKLSNNIKAIIREKRIGDILE